MYATCLFCNAPFEKNESIEAFPVGRRIAFDAAKGRLWVVCRKCERWSLSPLDERWEAIDQAERLYRDTRRRVATDNIGLAKIPEGTSLIRIGTPLRPEFAAWRYGDQFGRRRQRQMLIAGGGLAIVGAGVAGGLVAGIGVVAFGGLVMNSIEMAVHGRPDSTVARIRDADGNLMRIRRRHLAQTTLSQAADGSMAIKLRFMNFARYVFGYHGETARKFEMGLYGLPAPRRLALEMALHEEAERRALEGELGELERAWRDAEEIASISDDLLVPDTVRAKLDGLKTDDRAR